MFARSRYSIFALALPIALAACGRAPSPIVSAPSAANPVKHVLIVLIDTLRADHLGTYGYARNTSPNIDTLARGGVVFESAISTSSYTPESVASIFTGNYPSRQPWGAGWCAAPDPKGTTLAECFRNAGYKTAIYSASPITGYPEFHKGFDDYQGFSQYGVSGQGDKLVAWTLANLEKHKADQTFTYVHVMDPHSPYEPPDPYYQRFAQKRLEHPPRFHDEVRWHLPELMRGGFGPGDPRFEDLVTAYDGEIAWVDEQLKALFDGLAALGIRDKTLVVITADHGEEFLEHGYVEHAWKLYWETQHVPLIFHAPATLAPGRAPGLVSLVNLRPTLLALAGLDDPNPSPDGYALFAREGNAWKPHVEARPVFAELLIQMRTLVRTVFFDGWQYIQSPQWLTPEECAAAAARMTEARDEFQSGKRVPIDLWSPIRHEELYDLADDPKAARDRTPDAVEQLTQGRKLMDDLHKQCPPATAEAIKCKWNGEAGRLADQEQLKTLGYLGKDTANGAKAVQVEPGKP